MEIDDAVVRDALRRLLNVERDHIYGEKTGSPTARKQQVEREFDRILEELREHRGRSGTSK